MRVESASPREKHGVIAWVVSKPRSPVPASLYLLALQLKPSLPRASDLHTLPFGFNPGDTTGTQGIGFWSAEVC